MSSDQICYRVERHKILSLAIFKYVELCDVIPHNCWNGSNWQHITLWSSCTWSQWRGKDALACCLAIFPGFERSLYGVHMEIYRL